MLCVSTQLGDSLIITMYPVSSGSFESLRNRQEGPGYRPYPGDGSSHTTEPSERPKPPKRTKPIPPESHKQNPKTRRVERERLKKQNFREDVHARRQHMEGKFMKEVYTEARAYFDLQNGTFREKKRCPHIY